MVIVIKSDFLEIGNIASFISLRADNKKNPQEKWNGYWNIHFQQRFSAHGLIRLDH